MYFQITELAGYTARVSDMFKVFDDVGKGKYERQMVLDNVKQSKGPDKLYGPLKILGEN